jgi:hypothetical protein
MPCHDILSSPPLESLAAADDGRARENLASEFGLLRWTWTGLIIISGRPARPSVQTYFCAIVGSLLAGLLLSQNTTQYIPSISEPGLSEFHPKQFFSQGITTGRSCPLRGELRVDGAIQWSEMENQMRRR